MKSLAAFASASVILLVHAGTADAYSRTGGGSGPRGGAYSTSGSGSCAGHACTSAQSATGPRGNVATRSNSGSCSGGGCTINHSLTGPAGRSATRGVTYGR